MASKVLFVIPARLASTRLPRKLLLLLDDQTGKTVLQSTFEHVLGSKHATDKNVYIATGDEEIQSVATGFGARVQLTTQDLASGSDRAAEAARILGKTSEVEVIVNVQGDEPFVNPGHIDAVVEGLVKNPWADVATCAVPVTTKGADSQNDPSKVKVVTSNSGAALYFSRSPIPHNSQTWLRHVGLYAYRPNALERFSKLPQSPLERSESLEQLRLLQNDMKIHVSTVADAGFGGVDVKEDFDRAKAHYARLKKQAMCFTRNCG